MEISHTHIQNQHTRWPLTFYFRLKKWVISRIGSLVSGLHRNSSVIGRCPPMSIPGYHTFMNVSFAIFFWKIHCFSSYWGWRAQACIFIDRISTYFTLFRIRCDDCDSAWTWFTLLTTKIMSSLLLNLDVLSLQFTLVDSKTLKRIKNNCEPVWAVNGERWIAAITEA